MTPDCAPTANAVYAPSGAVNPSALPGFKTSQIKLDQASCRYIQMKNALAGATLKIPTRKITRGRGGVLDTNPASHCKRFYDGELSRLAMLERTRPATF